MLLWWLFGAGNNANNWDQVGGPPVPLLGLGDEIETPNWTCRTRAIHLLNSYIKSFASGTNCKVMSELLKGHDGP